MKSLLGLKRITLLDTRVNILKLHMILPNNYQPHRIPKKSLNIQRWMIFNWTEIDFQHRVIINKLKLI